MGFFRRCDWCGNTIPMGQAYTGVTMSPSKDRIVGDLSGTYPRAEVEQSKVKSDDVCISCERQLAKLIEGMKVMMSDD